MKNNKKTVVLITPPSHTHRTAEENLGIGYLASVLRINKFSVVIIDAWLYNYSMEKLTEKILQIKNVFLIGISCYRSSLDDVKEIIKNLRQSGYHGAIVAGGYGPTFHDIDFLKVGVDVVLKGEAEESIIQLANLLNNQKYQSENLSSIPGVSWLNQVGQVCSNKAIKVNNLDSLPFPSRDTITMNQQMKNPTHLVTSRGCTSNCLFCSIISFDRLAKGETIWRQRSVSNVIEEIKYLFNEYGVSTFKIVDDSFIEEERDLAWGNSFLNQLQRNNLKIRFRTQVKANVLTNELVVCLKAAGWFSTSIGIENFSESSLSRMNKSASLQNNLEALAMLEKNGIYVTMNMILFDHATTWQDLKNNFFYLDKLNWPVTKGLFTEMYAAEGTSYTRLLKRDNFLLPQTNFMNRQYSLIDRRVETAYACFKKWQKAHSVIYDHAINPLTAPKDLPDDGYQKYFSAYRPLYKTDLWFFAKLIDFLENDNSIDLLKALEFSDDLITQTMYIFHQVEREIIRLDSLFNISYQADVNPFLHIPGK